MWGVTYNCPGTGVLNMSLRWSYNIDSFSFCLSLSLKYLFVEIDTVTAGPAANDKLNPVQFKPLSEKWKPKFKGGGGVKGLHEFEQWTLFDPGLQSLACFFTLLYIERTWFSVIGAVHVVGRATSWWYKLPCLVSSFGSSSSCPTCWDRLGSPSYSRLLYLCLSGGIRNLVVSCSWELLGVVLVIHLAHPVPKISS